MSDDAMPWQSGFWLGLKNAHAGEQPLPPNPYYLRTPERTQWSLGYAAGRQLGKEQLTEAKRIANSYNG